jgi:hypothetical protein
MRRLMPLVPALCTFGPLEMVQGYESPYHLVSVIASLITALGTLILFANVMQLINQRDLHDGTVREAPKNRFLTVALRLLLPLLLRE